MILIEVKIRLPEETHKEIKEFAAEQNRSMNKQIVTILQDAARERATKVHDRG